MRPPADFEPYKSTPRFTTDTVPAALTRRHNTRVGVWGHIQVFAGSLTLTRYGQTCITEEVIAANDGTFVAPEEPHYVSLGPGTEFQVTFYRAPSGSASGP